MRLFQIDTTSQLDSRSVGTVENMVRPTPKRGCESHGDGSLVRRLRQVAVPEHPVEFGFIGEVESEGSD